MAAKYWLKLYYDMLDDPKIGRLRPALRWRFIECLLVAGECDDDGYIPDSEGYAWRVRANPDVVDTELTELAESGLLSRVDGRWHVTKFNERQAALTSTERWRQWQSRQHKQEYDEKQTDFQRQPTEVPTKRLTDTDKIREDKKRKEQTARVSSSDKITSQELPAEASPNFERDDLRRRMVAEISKVVRETLTVSNKRIEAEDYADAWIDMGATDEDIPGFTDYWKRLPDKRYAGPPYLKSLGSHFKDYFNGRRNTSGISEDWGHDAIQVK